MFYTLLKIQRSLEALYQTVISSLRILLRFRYRNPFRCLPAQTGHLVVLGNGPSLNESLSDQPDFLMDADLMAVNQFVLSGQYEILKPSLYVLLDIGFFKDSTIPRVKEITDQMILSFRQKTTWPVQLFIPYEGKDSRLHRELSGSGIPVEFVFFNRTNIEGLRGFRHWAYSRNLGMPKPQNVLIGCLMIALCLRFSQIYLIGADHSWLENIQVDDQNRLISIEKHFYDGNRSGKPTIKEHPETLKKMRLHDYLYDLARTFSSYHDIRIFADARGAQIINASKSSYIDAFDRLR